jgi:hypothetical protein
MQTNNGTVIDRRGNDETNYRLPDGGGVMPVPRVFPTEAPIPTGSGAPDTGATVDTGRRVPSSHPALR